MRRAERSTARLNVRLERLGLDVGYAKGTVVVAGVQAPQREG
ncbi:hypothetical protein [Arthrobacter sp. AFG7.2]|nr:hypothetical protein [Arthrobacter sp. AFG7.2]